MALAFDAVTSGSVVAGGVSHDPPITTASITVAHTCSGTDRLLVVGAAWWDGAGNGIPSGSNSITTATYNNVGLTYYGALNQGGRNLALYYMINPPSGTYNVFIEWTHSDEFADIMITAGISNNSFNGADQSSQFTNVGSGQGSNNTITVTLSGLTSGNLILDNAVSSKATLTVGANQTQRTNFTYGTLGATQRSASSTQSVADGGVMSWTRSIGTGAWATYAVEVKGTTGASASKGLASLGVG